jgi:hypothetical protein
MDLIVRRRPAKPFVEGFAVIVFVKAAPAELARWNR